jgi:hypothetical protein
MGNGSHMTVYEVAVLGVFSGAPSRSGVKQLISFLNFRF